MRRSLAGVCALFVVLSTVVRADITVTTMITVEGGAAAMAGGGMTPKTVMRIKGTKARTDIEVMGQAVSMIADATTHQLLLLRPDQKTAQLVEVPKVPAGGDAVTPPATLPKMDLSLKPTGRTQTLAGALCDEYTFTLNVSMAEMAPGGQMPPEAASAMQDMRMLMNGSVWMAKNGPGVAEYTAFQKLALDAQMAAIFSGSPNGMSSGGMDKILRGLSGAEGMPYLTDMTMTFDGTGPAVEIIKQMGPMKVTSKVTAVSIDPIAEDAFTVPADYQTIKQ